MSAIARNKKVWIIVAVFVALAVVLRPHPVDNGNKIVALSGSAPDSLDPGMSYMALSWQMFFNVYDGLITYKRVEGKEGNELIPDLATAMPTVTDNGATYAFTMHKGVKFAPPANREVLPSDVKASIERLFKLPSPGMGFYMVIDGAEAFANGKAKDISGIVIDDQARTITFHLVQPDATFNYKLAMMFAVALPKGTPAKDMTMRGFAPGTGPYRFTKYVSQREIDTARNPNFHEWTPEIPDGKSEGMVVKLGPAADNSVTKIKQGDADLSFEGPGLSQMPRLKKDPHFKNNLHHEPTAGISYVFMNTQQPPFNNFKVRQAVNFAIDRDALVKMMGGRAIATENLLPPLFPAVEQHHFYKGPDLAKAHKLMAESGVKPGKISFWCYAADGPNPTAEYMQHVLNELGFTTELKCLDPAVLFTTLGNPKNHAQIGFGGWQQDFPEGVDFIGILLNGARITPEANQNTAMFKDADADIARIDAMLDMDERAAAWNELDASIMRDYAPWAPYAVPVNYSFVSDRVCNYQAHPVYGLMFDKIKIQSLEKHGKCD